MMSIHIIAQTAAQDGPSWAFWVSAVGIPLVLLSIARILHRLGRGEEKFDSHAEKLAKIEITLVHQNETMKSQTTTLNEIRDEVGHGKQQFTEKLGSVSLEGVGTLGQLRAQMEREFLRKTDFQIHEAKAEQRHTEIMNAIARKMGVR